MPKYLYLDHNATTPLHPDVAKKLKKNWDVFGNPSSLHATGRAARNALDIARQRITDALGVSRRKLIFVGSGSEANNQVIHSVPPGAHLITSTVEHACIRNSIQAAIRRGVLVSEIDVDTQGRVDLDRLRSAIRPETRLITIMMANNETGSIQPIAEISQIAQSHGIPFHTDAVQAVGKMPFFFGEWGVECATISAHKLYGPKGIAALLIPSDEWVTPFIYGGSQELSLRAGTESVPLAMAFADAIEIAVAEQAVESVRLLGLKQAFLESMASLSDMELNSPLDGLANTINLSIKGVLGESIVRNMDLQGIALSTGSACSTGSVDPSHVIAALGKPEWVTKGAFRISMGRDTTAEDMAQCSATLHTVIEKLRMI